MFAKSIWLALLLTCTKLFAEVSKENVNSQTDLLQVPQQTEKSLPQAVPIPFPVAGTNSQSTRIQAPNAAGLQQHRVQESATQSGIPSSTVLTVSIFIFRFHVVFSINY